MNERKRPTKHDEDHCSLVCYVIQRLESRPTLDVVQVYKLKAPGTKNGDLQPEHPPQLLSPHGFVNLQPRPRHQDHLRSSQVLDISMALLSLVEINQDCALIGWIMIYYRAKPGYNSPVGS